MERKTNRRFSTAVKLGRVLLGAAIAITGTAATANAGTIGLVVTGGWFPAGQYSSQGKDECPSGFNKANRENYRAQFKTEEEFRSKVAQLGNVEMNM